MAELEPIATLAQALVTELIAAGQTVATAESCTGGWIAKSLTDVSGSSQAFGYGVVSYSNGAKESILGKGEQLTFEVVLGPTGQELRGVKTPVGKGIVGTIKS